LPEWMRYRSQPLLPRSPKARDRGHPQLDSASTSGPPAKPIFMGLKAHAPSVDRIAKLSRKMQQKRAAMIGCPQ
jgi:hypothetical protein